MHLGRERGIIRWDAHYALLQARLARVEAELAALPDPLRPADGATHARLLHDQAHLLRAVAALGPSPRARMG